MILAEFECVLETPVLSLPWWLSGHSVLGSLLAQSCQPFDADGHWNMRGGTGSLSLSFIAWASGCNIEGGVCAKALGSTMNTKTLGLELVQDEPAAPST